MAGNKNSPASGGPTGGLKDSCQSQQRQRRKKNKRPENEFYDLTLDAEDDVCLNCGENGHSEGACTKQLGRGGPQWALSDSEAGPSRPRDDGEGRPAELAKDPAASTNKFMPFRRMAYTFNFGDSDEEKDGDGVTGEEGSKVGTGAPSQAHSPPPVPPPDSPPPPPLLLPDHVTMRDQDEEAADSETGCIEDVDENADMTGIAVLDDSRATGAIRYYDPRATDEFFANADLRSLCKRCKRPGHIERNCDVEICLRCGEEGHQRTDCPYGLTCRYCGLSGHSATACKQRAVQAHETGSTTCGLCGSNRHGTTGCELAWRTYVYYPPDVREEILERRAEAKGWKLEAVGNNPLAMFCFNCAAEGHLGDDCRQPKGTKAPITAYPTAFSAVMAGRGPYAASHLNWQPPARHPAGTHTRFDDDLPGVNPGFAGFGGSAPGRRGREKMMARQRGLERRDDRDDWFSSRNNQRGGWTRQRSPERRPAHGTLASRISGMGPAPRFGQMSAPGRSSSYRNDRDRGSRYGGEAELEEGEWRRSGAGGGPVEGWGAEMDRADRDARRARDDRIRDDRPRAGPSRRGGAGRGQRYTGGY